MNYYQIDNPGTANWITHEDNERAQISQYGPNIWVTENTEWASRVGAVQLTKEQAQDICNKFIDEAKAQWDPESVQPEPQYFDLP